jgi:hypothetical protein
VLLVANGRLDDELMECVWDEGDGNVNLGDLLVESLAVGNIKRDGVAVGETFTELLCAIQSAAGNSDRDVGLTENASCRPTLY